MRGHTGIHGVGRGTMPVIEAAEQAAAGWRSITVVFTEREDAGRRRAAVAHVRADLEETGAIRQSMRSYGPGWASWTFRPGRYEPVDLIRVVQLALRAHDPATWLFEVDDY
jgi:hypothetical protein